MMDCLPGRDFAWVGPHGRSVSLGLQFRAGTILSTTKLISGQRDSTVDGAGPGTILFNNSKTRVTLKERS
jgi:hypothetical protein